MTDLSQINFSVTILLPVYNCVNYIQESLGSILNQTFRNLEVIVIDDASTDKTVEAIQAITDDRIKLIQKPINTGYTDSLNMGLEIARGKYIARMDADDIAYPERIAKQVAYMETHPECVLCGTWINLIPENKLHTYPINHEEIVAQLFRINALCHPSVMMRKSVIEEHQLRYDHNYEPTEDYELWTRMALVGQIHNIPEPLLDYRVHVQQISATKNAIQKAHLKNIRNKFIKEINTEINASIFDIEKPANLSLAEIPDWLKSKYSTLNQISTFKDHPFTETSIHIFIAFQKKELIRNITKRANKVNLFAWFGILRNVPEAYRYLGVTHTTTFFLRSIAHSF
jgi:glycosyltransferase involved in cell wall biosynthesis